AVPDQSPQLQGAGEAVRPTGRAAPVGRSGAPDARGAASIGGGRAPVGRRIVRGGHLVPSSQLMSEVMRRENQRCWISVITTSSRNRITATALARPRRLETKASLEVSDANTSGRCCGPPPGRLKAISNTLKPT